MISQRARSLISCERRHGHRLGLDWAPLAAPIAAMPGVVERPDVSDVPSETGGKDWIVTVYDNDWNTYEQVMTILMLATGCTSEEAYIETWEIDHLGSSVVHRACQEECRRVAEIIATIGIRAEATLEG